MDLLVNSNEMYYTIVLEEVSWVIAGVVPKGHTRGKSELCRAGCWVTPSGSNPKESATDMETADGHFWHRQGCNGAVRAHQRCGDASAR